MFTNSNWFAFEDDKAIIDRSTDSIASPSRNSEDTDEVVVGESEDLVDRASSEMPNSAGKFPETATILLGNGSVDESKEDTRHLSPTIIESDKSPEWVEWRETTDSSDLCCSNSTVNVPNGDIEVKDFDEKDDDDLGVGKCEGDADISNQEGERSFGLASKALPVTNDLNLDISQAKSPELASGSPNIVPSVSGSAVQDLEHEKLIEEDK